MMAIVLPIVCVQVRSSQNRFAHRVMEDLVERFYKHEIQAGTVGSRFRAQFKRLLRCL